MNEQTQLLIPFWETVLDRSAEDMKTRTVMASHFAKINAVFLGKKPAEVNRSSYPSTSCEYRAPMCIDVCIHPFPARRCGTASFAR